MTTCPSCSQENPEGTSFCGHCGKSLIGIEGNLEKGIHEIEGAVTKGMHEMISGMDSMGGVVSHFVENILKTVKENLIKPYLDHKVKVVRTMMAVLALLIITTSVLVFYDVIGAEAYLVLIGTVLGYMLATMGRALSMGN
jgi:hypothetical protein